MTPPSRALDTDADAGDTVDFGSEASFPASDPPSWMGSASVASEHTSLGNEPDPDPAPAPASPATRPGHPSDSETIPPRHT